MSGHSYEPTTTAFELIHHARPFTTNAERKMTAFERARTVKEWRQAFALLAWAEKLPKRMATPIVITAMPVLRDHRRQDVGACYPAVKAAIDGLVDAGIIEDDDPDYVASIVFVRPELGAKGDALVIRIETL